MFRAGSSAGELCSGSSGSLSFAAALLPQLRAQSLSSANSNRSSLSGRAGKMHPCSQLTDCRTLTSKTQLVLSNIFHLSVH